MEEADRALNTFQIWLRRVSESATTEGVEAMSATALAMTSASGSGRGRLILEGTVAQSWSSKHGIGLRRRVRLKVAVHRSWRLSASR